MRSLASIGVLLCAILWDKTLGAVRRTSQFPLLMPGVVPKYADSYLCTGIRLDPTEDYYITAFEPNATMHVAHHIIVLGCTEPGSFDTSWICADVGMHAHKTLAPACNGNQEIMYVWARDAPKLDLPKDVGFKVGGMTKVQYMILQVHYASVEHFKDGAKDHSGVVLHYTKTPQPKVAGVLIMLSGGRVLPHSIEYLETACTIEEPVVIHPFAFRTHTHALGRVVSGYKIENTDRGHVWTLIGKKDPQLPQMFYPVEQEMTIKKGDMIAARCTMESNRDTTTRVGLRTTDEMCNFYIMYWRRSNEKIKYPKRCFKLGPPYYYWQFSLNNIPEEASTLPIEDESANFVL